MSEGQRMDRAKIESLSNGKPQKFHLMYEAGWAPESFLTDEQFRKTVPADYKPERSQDRYREIELTNAEQMADYLKLEKERVTLAERTQRSDRSSLDERKLCAVEEKQRELLDMARVLPSDKEVYKKLVDEEAQLGEYLNSLEASSPVLKEVTEIKKKLKEAVNKAQWKLKDKAKEVWEIKE